MKLESFSSFENPQRLPKPFFIVGLIAVLLIGVGVYVFNTKSNKSLQPTSQSNSSTSTVSSNEEDKVETVTIQEDLSFSVLVPKGYSLQQSSGDVLVEIGSSDEKSSVLFYKSTGGGERGTAVPYTIDNIPFEIEYSETLNCPAYLSAPNTKFYEGAFTSSLYFAISLNCGDDAQQDNARFERIIGSIRFSPHLKKILMGEELSPLLKNSGVTYKDIDIANEERKGIISQGTINKSWKMYTGPTDNQNGKFSVEFPSEWVVDSVERRRLYLPNLDKQKYYVLIGTASKLYSNGQNGNNCETKAYSAGNFEFCSKKEGDSTKIIATLNNKDFPYKGAPYYAFLISYPVESDLQYKSIFDDILNTVKRIE